MQKQNPKGFKRMTAKMGELPAMEEVEEGAVSAAQRAAIAISKKEKAGKPGYDKEGKSLKNKKEEIEEAKDLDPATVGQIASATDRNDHNGSLMILAKALKDKSAQKILMNIQGMHKEFGHMPDELIKLRGRVHDNLMRQSSKKFKNHKEIIGSF